LPLADGDRVGARGKGGGGREQQESRQNERGVASAGSCRPSRRMGSAAHDAGDAEVERKEQPQGPAEEADVGGESEGEADDCLWGA